MYIDYMSRFKTQEEYFKNEKLPDGKTSWPYQKPTEQLAYNNWLAQVLDPVSQEFYKSHDNPPQENRRQVQTIIRVRDRFGKEHLYTVGEILGYNSFGDPLSTSCYRPEVTEKTNFKHRTVLDGKTQQLKRECQGPSGTELLYSIDYSPEEVDKLYKMRKDDGITFIVKDEVSGLDITVKGKSLKDSFELFRNKNFDYLFNVEYRSRQELEDERNEREGKSASNKK